MLGLLARSWRLNWQPLWWDEGYSVYFATEPLTRMLWLTAHDIHPPLYYALLHGWIAVAGAPTPTALRAFSVLLGAAAVPAIFWLARQLFPAQRLAPWLAAGLLALSPMHLFYSQEVRMYALALLLALLANGALWASVRRLRSGAPALPALVGYAVAGALLLSTLYYGALLLLAHALWLVWLVWRRRALPLSQAGKAAGAWLAIAVANLPWLLYALPKLVGYVAQKVASDQDVALNPLTYVTRHLSAFLGGHLAASGDLALWAGIAGLLLLIALLLTAARARSSALVSPTTTPDPLLSPTAALAFWLVIPFLCAWLISLRSPFFPVGGERLLLFTLPAFLLLIAWAGDRALAQSRAGARALAALALLLVAIAAGAGVYRFYTTPRYTQEDYRPLLAHVALQGRDDDTLVAIFPWQVGYWRAYKPAALAGPQVRLLDDFAVTWGEPVQGALDEALVRGSVWLPEPLAFGSDLPAQMESWLAAHAANLENRWYSSTTRLTAWAALAPLRPHAPAARFGSDLTLFGAATQQEPAPADNTPLAVALLWDAVALQEQEWGATLRLQDGDGRTWASRDYAPIGAFAPPPEGELPLALESLGLIVPAGIPPGAYTLQLGVLAGDRLVAAQVDGSDGPQTLAPIGEVIVRLPAAPPNPARLPMRNPLRAPVTQAGLTLLGATLPVTPTLAGTTLELALFAQAEDGSTADAAGDHTLRIRLVGRDGGAEWQGFPLSGYPTSVWTPGFAVTLPIAMPLPPDLPAGAYSVRAAWLDASGVASAETELGRITVTRRTASFTPITLAQVLPAPVQFGTHARLHSYTLQETDSAYLLALAWEVLQPIWPPHEIFVHLDAGDPPQTLAQDDGPPVAASGLAPTGAWQPGEWLETTQVIPKPAADAPAGSVLRVGLFEPGTGTRLPLSIDGAPQGDALVLPLGAP